MPRLRALAVTAVAAAPIVLLDQLTKWWALEALSDGPIHVAWTLDLRITFNTGAAFSTAPGLTPFLTAAGVVLVGMLVLMSGSATKTSAAVALGLLLGGAVGNLSDRLLRDHDGAVIDFIDFGWYPVFNVADMALVAGAILLVLVNARAERAATAS